MFFRAFFPLALRLPALPASSASDEAADEPASWLRGLQQPMGCSMKQSIQLLGYPHDCGNLKHPEASWSTASNLLISCVLKKFSSQKIVLKESNPFKRNKYFAILAILSRKNIGSQQHHGCFLWSGTSGSIEIWRSWCCRWAMGNLWGFPVAKWFVANSGFSYLQKLTWWSLEVWFFNMSWIFFVYVHRQSGYCKSKL